MKSKRDIGVSDVVGPAVTLENLDFVDYVLEN